MKYKKLVILIFLVLLSLISFRKCSYYNYAIDVSKNSSTEYESFNKNGKEFVTTLFHATSDKPEGYIKITLVHLADYVSYIEDGLLGSQLSIDTNLPVEIIKDSISVKHFDKVNREFIPYLKKVDYGFESDSNGGFVLLYEAKGLPKLIEEEVSFEIIENGKKRLIKYTFTIEKTYNGTTIDRLMGV